jgi:hypothetical protein
VGDWIISNGTAWEKVDLTDAVSSVFGRTGAVVGVSTDYSAVGLTNTAIGAANPSSGAFTSLSSSSTTTLNGTTVPASKTLVVTTDKLSALAATTSAELAGVISDETGSGALVFATSPTLVTPALGAATATSISASGTVTGSNLSGTNTGDQTITLTGGVTGSGTGSFAATVVTNANLTGAITSVGNATSLGSFSSANLASALTDETGSGANVFATSPTLVTPILGTPQSGTLTSCTGLPISTGVSGLGTGIATALAVNTGSAGAPVLFNGALGTPTSGTVTNLTGTASININGTVGATAANTGAFTTVTATGTISTSGGSLETSRTGAVDAFVRISADAGRSKNLSLNTAGARRWTVSSNSTAESGSNAGSDFVVTAYSDADASLGSALTITRANRSAVFAGGINSTAIGSGTASTGAFTTLSASSTLDVGSTSTLRFTQLTNNDQSNCRLRFINTGSGGQTWDILGGTNGASNAGLGFLNGSTTYMQLSTTGLAVTGTLSATSTVTSAIADKISLSGVGASDQYFLGANYTNADGTESVTNAARASWRFRMKNVATNEASIDFRAANAATNAFTAIGTFSSTGLAVTGALSATSHLQVNGETFANSNSMLGASFTNAVAGASLRSSDDSSGVTFQAFRKSNNTVIGSISRVSTTDAVVYNTTSDARLKENLRDFTDSGRLIDSLKPRVFDWKNSDENGKNVVGFIAQEEHAADPIFAHIGAVSVGDEDPETITKQWQRSDSALIPILVAELKSVRARLAALESK